MTGTIVHRGPDDEGVWLSRPDRQGRRVGLGNCRLAILDLSAAGHQPMLGPGERTVLTYNGEVYNFAELGEELKARGERLRSKTDTEVVHRLLDRDGPGALARLNGMFGLAHWDEAERRLLLARDRYGTKPLYYAELGDGRLVFASEIKALLACPDVPCEPNLEAVDVFLRHLWVPGPATMFRGIFKLPPGHYLVWRDGRIQIEQYWDVAYTAGEARNEDELAEELRDILHRAVKRHLIADVPVGLFLSGGLDSTTVLALATRLTGIRAKAYTIAYRDQDARLEQAGRGDEQHARQAAKTLDADYHPILIDPDVAALLPEVVHHLDEPVADPAAISTLLIARAARRDVKVLLSGQGADEVFGGYRVYAAAQQAGRIGALPRWSLGLARSGIDLAAKLPTDRFGVPLGRRMAARRYLDRLLVAAPRTAAERFATLRAYYWDGAQMPLYGCAFRAFVEQHPVPDPQIGYFETAPAAGELDRFLYADLKTFLPELNLTYTDKLTSAASVEGRVPFLDNELFDFAARLPADLKVRGGGGKYLLRKAVRGLVPDEIIRRGKAGFGAPVRKWLRDELRPLTRELLSPDALRRRGYFDPAAVAALVHRNEEGVEDQPLRVWALLTLEVWHRTFVDHRPVPRESTSSLPSVGASG
jgi:asparagine synthase (glutamine-hydrolysing)